MNIAINKGDDISWRFVPAVLSSCVLCYRLTNHVLCYVTDLLITYCVTLQTY
jgi:hypothetical protein